MNIRFVVDELDSEEMGRATNSDLFGGTLVSPESGARGDNVMASTEFTPEIGEEALRLVRSDRIRSRGMSRRRVRSPFTQTITERENRWGGKPYTVEFRSDLAQWPMNGGTVDLAEVPSEIMTPEEIMIAREEGKIDDRDGNWPQRL